MSGLTTLSTAQVAVLNVVYKDHLLYDCTHEGWTSHSDIARQLQKNYQSISNTTASLVHRGYLLRRRLHRATYYLITEEGVLAASRDRRTYGKDT